MPFDSSHATATASEIPENLNALRGNPQFRRPTALATAVLSAGVLATTLSMAMLGCTSTSTQAKPAQASTAADSSKAAPEAGNANRAQAKVSATAGATSGATAGTTSDGTARKSDASSSATAASASAARATAQQRTGPALFSDVTQPGKGTPKPRATATAKPTGEGKIIPGSVNVYTFNPNENFVPVDPSSTSLAQVLADLGPDAIEWYQHVQTLSNPWFEGRVPGSDGIERAAEYCEFWMTKAGLEPAFASGSQANPVDPWRQPFDLPGRERRVSGAEVTFDGRVAEGARAMRNSGGGKAELPLVFVGYGIESGKDGYASFGPDERLDGKVVLVMRGEPLDANGKSRWGGDKFTSASSLAAKLDALRKRGAAAILVTEPPEYGGKKADLAAMSPESLGGVLGIPCIVLDTATANDLVKACDQDARDLMALRQIADTMTASDAAVRTIALREDRPVKAETKVDTGEIVTHNVGGILGGRGNLKDEWIVVGAHYDHVGYGMYGADPANRGKVHPGADDNASGTSGMLVLAKRLAKEYAEAPADANLRSVLFLAFSAEEMGLNGSRAYVKSPSIAADKVDIMLNMDMIGRMRSKELVVGGVESAKGFSSMLEPFFKESGLTIYADPSGRGPSDHSSFFGAGIPVLFFFSGVHDIYHQPGDVGYTVDPRGVPAILDLVQKITMWRAASPERLEFGTGARAQDPAPRVVDTAPGGNDRGYAPVRLGIQPGMAEDGESGILVENVSPNTSAADAGIKVGDILLSWDGVSLGSTADMMTKLRASKPGDIAKMRVMRDGKEIEINVELKASTAQQKRPQDD
ncbi:MAG: M28 family peptidase [Limnohabitans sp.]|nr:M28 family peptidase [Limnohabitans sp.]